MVEQIDKSEPELETTSSEQPSPSLELPSASSVDPLERAVAHTPFAEEVRPEVEEPSRSKEVELQRQVLYLAAELENTRKRAERDIEEVRRFGIEKLLGDLLPVLDSMDRAFCYHNDEPDPFVRGLQMILKQMEDLLARYGVKRFSSLGETFNPERHEALGVKQTHDAPPGVIVEELFKGYFLHDRLFRPAKVIVSVASEGVVADEGSEPARAD